MYQSLFPSDHFAAFAFSSADILFEVDASGAILFAEGATGGLLERPGSELVGSEFASIVSEQHRKRLGNIFNALERLNRIDAVSLHLISKQGGTVPFRLSGVHVDHKGGRYYLSLRSETEMQSPRDLDIRDPASGLLEKESFSIKASERLSQAAEKGEAVDVTIVDFPGLEEMLESLGRERAKMLLRVIGEYLREQAVDTDAAGVIDRKSYSIITPGALDKKQLADGLQEEVARKVGSDVKLQITTRQVKTASEEYPLTQQDTANAILYTLNKFANERGEDFDIESLNESYEEMLDSTLEHITEFRRTLNESDFEMAFQPIVNIRSGMVHHYECLVRLNSREKFSNPFEFISFGEQSGLINEFDLAVTQKALALLHAKRKQGQKVALAINLSGRSLGSNLFLDSFLSMLRDAQSVRTSLIVEITESYKIENMEMANDFIQTLRSEGNLVCLDDFGSGESSFDYLRYLNVDFVKIDGSYVRDSMKTERGRKLLKAMANLCNSLEMTTIGEMVETEREAEFLYECGVKYGQGYLIGKPETDVKVLESYGKVTHTYSGIFNARRFKSYDEDESQPASAQIA